MKRSSAPVVMQFLYQLVLAKKFKTPELLSEFEEELDPEAAKNEPVWDPEIGVNGTLFVGLANGLGAVNWELVGTLFLSWVVVYLIIWKGLHSSGKVLLAFVLFGI